MGQNRIATPAYNALEVHHGNDDGIQSVQATRTTITEGRTKST